LRDLTNNENLIARELEKTIENDINSLLRSEKKKSLRDNAENRELAFLHEQQMSYFLCFPIK
jgi:hypothetical protein